MLSLALSGSSQVISCHLRDVGIFIYGTVGYTCYCEKQQGMEVLGVDLSPSESFKDQFVVCP
jgi:hypothetical protein